MKKIKLGFIGCGRISASHFDVLKKIQDRVEVVAICDPTEEKAQQAASIFSSKYYTDINQMLKDCEIDIAVVATPNAMHPDHSILCAKHGVDVLCEKPLAISADKARELKEVFEQRGCKFFMIYQNRYNDTVSYLRDAIDKGRFGRIYSITSNVFWHRSQEYYDKRSWHGTKHLDGGAFMTQASHYVDLLHWFSGSQVDYLYASLDTLARNIETEDSGSVIIKWKNGVIGNINLSILTYPDNYEGSITILGEKGSVKLGGVALNKIEHNIFEEKLPIDEDIKNLSYETDSVYGFGHKVVYDKLLSFYQKQSAANDTGINTINDNSLLASDGLVMLEEAYQSFQILDAILQSSETNMPVKF